MQAARCSVIPMPVEYISGDGFCAFKGVPAAESADFPAEVAVFNEQMAVLYGRNSSADSKNPPIRCVKDGPAAPEAYRLRITSNQVEVGATTAAGIYHGLQTLRQLLISGYEDDSPGVGGRFVITNAEINDAPRFAWRGFMLDCSRHFYQCASIKKIIDALSLHHINVFHWHLTDDQGWRLPVPEYPNLVETGSRRRNSLKKREVWSGGSYTEADIREIVAFAAARHITVVPEVDLPGHTGAALTAYPELGCTGGPYHVEDRHGIFDEILCAGNDAIFPFVEAVFKTLVRLFPGEYVHIGGDEAPKTRWEESPQCRKRLADLGLSDMNQLQVYLTRRFAGMLAELGKTAVGWDEVLEGDTPESPLPEGLVVMSWRGVEGGLEAVSKGRPVVMTPSTEGCYLVLPGMTAEQEKLVLGGQANLWSEMIPADRFAEYMIFPRIAAKAEALWTPRALKDYRSFCERLDTHRHRLDMLDILQYRGI